MEPIISTKLVGVKWCLQKMLSHRPLIADISRDILQQMEAWSLVYYRIAVGRSPVRDYIVSLDERQRARVTFDLDRSEGFWECVWATT